MGNRIPKKELDELLDLTRDYRHAHDLTEDERAEVLGRRIDLSERIEKLAASDNGWFFWYCIEQATGAAFLMNPECTNEEFYRVLGILGWEVA